VYFASHLLAARFAYAIPLSAGMAVIASLYNSGAHHWFGVQVHQRSVTFPFPYGRDQINSIKYC
jgi:hypothetical protein